MSKQFHIFWFGKFLPMNTDLCQYDAGQFHFIKLMAHRMCELRGITHYDRPEFDESRLNFLDFLNQSNIKFGDSDFDWTPQGAFDVAEEYQSYDDVE